MLISFKMTWVVPVYRNDWETLTSNYSFTTQSVISMKYEATDQEAIGYNRLVKFL